MNNIEWTRYWMKQEKHLQKKLWHVILYGCENWTVQKKEKYYQNVEIWRRFDRQAGSNKVKFEDVGWDNRK